MNRPVLVERIATFVLVAAASAVMQLTDGVVREVEHRSGFLVWDSLVYCLALSLSCAALWRWLPRRRLAAISVLPLLVWASGLVLLPRLAELSILLLGKFGYPGIMVQAPVTWMDSGIRISASSLAVPLFIFFVAWLLIVASRLGARVVSLWRLFWRASLGWVVGCIVVFAIEIAMGSPAAGRFGFASVIPVAVACGGAVSRISWCAGSQRTTPRSLGVLSLVALLAASLIGRGWSPQANDVRVMIFEGNSDWSWTDSDFDQDSYGVRSTYNFVALREFSEVTWGAETYRGELSASALRGFDVVVLKMPTTPYSREDVSVLLDFVERGGGLVLIGDHTNVFGTSYALNQVCAPLGITYSFDAVHDSYFHQRQVLRNSSGLDSPVVSGVPDRLMATSCSLEVRPPAVPVSVGYSVYCDAGDYGNTSYFGDASWSAGEYAGPVVQSAVVSVGEGAVVALTDSTIFSTFTFYFPGIMETYAAAVQHVGREWLIRNEIAWFLLESVLLLAGIGLAALARPWWAVTLLVGVVVAVPAAECWDARASGLAQIVDRSADLGFVHENGRYRLPLTHETHPWDTDSLHTAFVWSQRVGRIPRVIADIAEVEDMRTVVLVDPSSEVCAMREIWADYLDDGGHLVILAGLTSDVGPTQELVRELAGVELSRGDGGGTISLVGEDESLQTSEYWYLSHGNPIAVDDAGRAVVADLDVLGGRLSVVGIGREMAVDRLGMPKSVPTARQRYVAEVLFRVFGQRPLGAEPRDE